MKWPRHIVWGTSYIQFQKSKRHGLPSATEMAEKTHESVKEWPEKLAGGDEALKRTDSPTPVKWATTLLSGLYLYDFQL